MQTDSGACVLHVSPSAAPASRWGKSRALDSNLRWAHLGNKRPMGLQKVPCKRCPAKGAQPVVPPAHSMHEEGLGIWGVIKNKKGEQDSAWGRGEHGAPGALGVPSPLRAHLQVAPAARGCSGITPGIGNWTSGIAPGYRALDIGHCPRNQTSGIAPGHRALDIALGIRHRVSPPGIAPAPRASP